MPPVEDEPGRIMSRLDPMDLMEFCMASEAPCPILTVAITEPTPIIIPSIVKRDLILFLRSVLYADFMSKKNANFTFFIGLINRLVDKLLYIGNGWHNPPVFNGYKPFSVTGYVFIV